METTPSATDLILGALTEVKELAKNLNDKNIRTKANKKSIANALRHIVYKKEKDSESDNDSESDSERQGGRETGDSGIE